MRIGLLFLSLAMFPAMAWGAICQLEPRDHEGTMLADILPLARQAENLPAFVRRLPEDLRSRAAFVYESGSLQPATPERPRTILFTNNGRLLVAYAGNTAESIFFDDKSCRWQFHHFDFSERVSKVDPPGQMECTRCHEGQPIWDTYPLWPHFYGGYDDGTKESSKEGAFYRRFQANIDEKIYQPLLGLEGLNTFTNFGRFARLYRDKGEEPPFVYYHTHKDETLFKVPLRGNTRLFLDPDNGARPLEKLTYELNRLQAVKLAASIERRGYSLSERLALLAATLDCQPARSFLPKALRRGAKRKLARLERQMRAKQTAYYEAKIAEMKKFAAPLDGREKNFEDRDFLRALKARLQYVLAARHWSMDDWALTRQRDSYSFFHSNYSIEILAVPLAWQLAREVPELKGFDGGDGYVAKDWCAVVKTALDAAEEKRTYTDDKNYLVSGSR